MAQSSRKASVYVGSEAGTVEPSRRSHDRHVSNARAISTFMKTKRMDPYMQRLQFTPPRSANDPDMPAKM